VLALCLQAFYLTKDQKAWSAVYGRPADRHDLYEWLQALRDGRDAGELGRLVSIGTSLPVAAVAGLVYGCVSLANRAPWALSIAGILLGLAALRTPRESYLRFFTGTGKALALFYTEFHEPYEAALERFRTRAPAVPEWGELALTNERRDILARACLFYLARSKTGPMSAAQLAKHLPSLPVGTAPQRLRDVLRAHPDCFYETARGRWQVGHSARLH
jgi:hypothetical protein